MARPAAYSIKKMIGFDQQTLDAIELYRRNQTPIPNQSEAIRRLIEIGLSIGASHTPGPHSGASKAAELAATQIDQMGDPSASDSERKTRKRRILTGPPEFVENREDQTKPKSRR